MFNSCVLIYGLGASGKACLNYCIENGFKKLRAIDNSLDLNKQQLLKNNYSNYLQVDLYLGKVCSEVLDGVTRMIVSPGISLDNRLVKQARACGIKVQRDIEWFSQLANAPIIAVTGSNGKTSVVTLLARLFGAYYKSIKVGGNSGIPVFALLSKQPVDYYIIECSSFQLENSSLLNFYCACILNITADHLDKHKDFATYLKAKHNIYNGAGCIIYNKDDLNININSNQVQQSISFSILETGSKPDWGLMKQDMQIYLTKFENKSENIVFARDSDLLLNTEVAYSNMLAALAIANYCKIPAASLAKEIIKFSGLPHRFEVVRQVQGITWINDSKATNVGAALAAIKSLNKRPKARIILIAGGQAKGVDLSDFCLAIQDKIYAALVLGQAAASMYASLKSLSHCYMLASMTDAVCKAKSLAIAGDYVLLSPACASFDMYTGYAERGKDFTDLVMSL